MKLTRATIPMCPGVSNGCGAELPNSHTWYEGNTLFCRCPSCDTVSEFHEWDYGYHTPDVEAIREVVREAADALARVADRLEGKP